MKMQTGIQQICTIKMHLSLSSHPPSSPAANDFVIIYKPIQKRALVIPKPEQRVKHQDMLTTKI